MVKLSIFASRCKTRTNFLFGSKMPRLIVPSTGGGMKLMRTLRAGELERLCCGAGEDEGDGADEGDGEVVGDSCAKATVANINTYAIGSLQLALGIRSNVILPVYVRKRIVAPFAIGQKFFIDGVGDNLIVQSIEANKVVLCSFCCVFPGRSRFH